MEIAHLTTVDLSLRYLILPQLEAAAEVGRSYGISAPGPFVAEVEERGVVHVPLPASTRGMSLRGDIIAMRQFWRAVRDIRPDVLHTHNPKPGIYGRILGRLAGVPIVVNTVHGLYATTDSPWWRRLVVYALEAVASRFSDAELVQNPEDLDLLGRLHIVEKSKLRFLGNGVDLGRFNPRVVAALRGNERSRLGVADEEIVIGMVGRLVAEKGVPELVEAARSLGDDVRIVVAGPNDPDKDDAISPELLERGRDSGVQFVGMRRDIEAFYSGLDIFVLPSHREGFPRAAMEAAACGLPLVVTDIRGCRQVVDEGVNGLLVPVADAAALASAISSLVSDPERREAMGEASVEIARQRFDETRVVEIVMETYRRLAEEKGLAWKYGDIGEPTLREAVRRDHRAIAALHAGSITSGFLSSLGRPFLGLLYRSLIESERGRVIVAVDEGRVIGFVAGTSDTGAFYREFLRRRFLAGGWRLVPALFRPAAWRQVWETFRYGGHDTRARAELLSMAVAPSARGRGVGRALVDTLLEEAQSASVRGMTVVVGADNAAAIKLYESAGFGDPVRIEVHRGFPSLELLWQSSGS